MIVLHVWVCGFGVVGFFNSNKNKSFGETYILVQMGICLSKTKLLIIICDSLFVNI